MGSMFLPSEMSGAEYFSLKIKAGALAGWLAWLACHLVHQNVAGSIPGWGDQCFSLSLSPFLSLSLKPIKTYPQVRIKKKLVSCLAKGYKDRGVGVGICAGLGDLMFAGHGSGLGLPKVWPKVLDATLSNWRARFCWQTPC